MRTTAQPRGGTMTMSLTYGVALASLLARSAELLLKVQPQKRW